MSGNRRLWCPRGYVPVADLSAVINARHENDDPSCSAGLLEINEYGPQIARHIFGELLTNGSMKSVGVHKGTSHIYVLPKQIWSGEYSFSNFSEPLYNYEAVVSHGHLELRIDGQGRFLDVAVSEDDLARICGWTPERDITADDNFITLIYDKYGNLRTQMEPQTVKTINKDNQIDTKKGGRPRSDYWDNFWVEVALCLAKSGDYLNQRPALQRHMCEWAETRLGDYAPSDPTIRKKLKLLFDEHEKSTGKIAGKQN